MSNSVYDGFTHLDQLDEPDRRAVSHDFIAKTQSSRKFYHLFAPDHTWSYLEVTVSSKFTANEIEIRAQGKTCLYSRTYGYPTDNLPVKMKVMKQSIGVRVPEVVLDAK